MSSFLIRKSSYSSQVNCEVYKLSLKDFLIKNNYISRNKLSLKDFPNKNKYISRVILSKTVPIADFFVTPATPFFWLC